MTKPVTIPNTFATATNAIPLSQLDGDFTAVANAINDANTYSNYAADTGSANAYVVTFTGVSTTYSAGLRIQFKAGNANTGASTLNVNAQGNKNITFQDTTTLTSGTIAANAIVDVMYDGTQFLLMNDPAGTIGTGDVVGPASATDNAVVRFDGTTGKLVQNSAVTVADTTGDITGGKYNGLTVTTTTGTLTITNGKTLAASNTLTLAGTDSTTMTFPSTSASIARTDAGQTFTGTQTFSSPIAVGSGGTGLSATPTNGQIDIGNGTGFTRATLTAGSGISITNGAGSISIAATGGGGSPGGSTTQVQYNNAGSFGGITNATTDGTTLSMTSPKIITAINDTNANELIKFTATASAVNEITVANAATTTNPVISATGGDTNIGITLTPKGTGGVTTANCLAVGGATPSTSGAGITFPATQSSSSDANTLDDYEEGTWTPTLANATGVTYTTQSGKYTKVGNLVTVSLYLKVSAATANSLAIFINGLPFTSSSSFDSGAYIARQSSFNTNLGDTLNILANNTAIGFYANTGGNRNLNSANVTLTGDLYISGFYYV